MKNAYKLVNSLKDPVKVWRFFQLLFLTKKKKITQIFLNIFEMDCYSDDIDQYLILDEPKDSSTIIHKHIKKK